MNAHRFPTWASLARDYLAIMATSVSSERAFSSAGISVTKRRNRLKGDVVEALQALKCAFKKSLFWRDIGPSSKTEIELEDEDEEQTDEVMTGGLEDELNIVIELDDDAEDEVVDTSDDIPGWLDTPVS